MTIKEIPDMRYSENVPSDGTLHVTIGDNAPIRFFSIEELRQACEDGSLLQLMCEANDKRAAVLGVRDV